MSDLYHSIRDSVVNDKNQKKTLSKYFCIKAKSKKVITKAHQEKMQLEFQSKQNNKQLLSYFVISVLIIVAKFWVYFLF